MGPGPVAVEGVPPVKVQLHAVGEQEELSVKVTVFPTTTVVGVPVKSAITLLTVIYPFLFLYHLLYHLQQLRIHCRFREYYR